MPAFIFWPRTSGATADPWAGVPEHAEHTSTSRHRAGPVCNRAGSDAGVLECHEDAAGQVMHTVHWTWESEPVAIPGHDNVVEGIGKINLINNFCIAATSNERTCMTCHAGYDWENAPANLEKAENVDCLACHADTATLRQRRIWQPGRGRRSAGGGAERAQPRSRQLRQVPLRRRRRQQRQAWRPGREPPLPVG
jgi:hypothetical protein